MKKRLLYITVLILTGIINSAFIYGQSNSFKLDNLKGKTWYYSFPNPHNKELWVKFKYSDNTQTSIHYIVYKETTLVQDFYLSDKIVDQFDYTKIGTKTGEYLIEEKGSNENGVVEFNICKILKLNEMEFDMKSLQSNRVLNFKCIDSYNMQYVLSKTPTHILQGAPGPLQGAFSLGRKADFLAGYDFRINTDQIPDRLYEDVHLTKFTNNAAQKRGKFLRKVALSSGYYLVAVRFGEGDNVTDVFCIVDGSGNVKSTLEGTVIVNGIMVKSCSVTQGQVIVSQAKPTVTSLSFANFPSDQTFPGNVITTFYNFSNSGFTKGSEYLVTKTFTKSLLSNPNKNSVAEY